MRSSSSLSSTTKARPQPVRPHNKPRNRRHSVSSSKQSDLHSPFERLMSDESSQTTATTATDPSMRGKSSQRRQPSSKPLATARPLYRSSSENNVTSYIPLVKLRKLDEQARRQKIAGSALDGAWQTTTCPSGHALNLFRTPRDGYQCSHCRKYFQRHTSLSGCRFCNYDICRGCDCSAVKREPLLPRTNSQSQGDGSLILDLERAEPW